MLEVSTDIGSPDLVSRQLEVTDDSLRESLRLTVFNGSELIRGDWADSVQHVGSTAAYVRIGATDINGPRVYISIGSHTTHMPQNVARRLLADLIIANGEGKLGTDCAPEPTFHETFGRTDDGYENPADFG